MQILLKPRTLLLIRGPSGSGKSTLAQQIKEFVRSQDATCEVCEADQYFMKEDGYNFSPSLLDQAHKYCKQKARDAVATGTDIVIVSNTSTKAFEMKPYATIASDFSYRFKILRKFVSQELAVERTKYRGNNHTIPEHVIHSQYERIIDLPGEILISENDEDLIKFNLVLPTQETEKCTE